MNAAAIRKLRRNVILLAMLSFVAVIVFTGGLINLSNNLQIRRSMKNMLDVIIAYDGELPFHEADSGNGRTDTAAYDTPRSSSSSPESPVTDLLSGFAAEYPYSTRYFAVLYDESGNLSQVKLSHIHSVDEEDAVNMAGLVRGLRHSFGRFGNHYFFEKADYEDGTSIVAVLDASIQVGLNESIVRSTVLICFAGLFITFIAVFAASGRMIRPEIENARKQKMFITNASHELKTPLAVIRANTELEELMNGETEWTRSTLRQIDRLNGLIQNLVMIARAQEAEEPGALKDIDASAAILESVQPYESLARQEEKTLTIDIVPGLHMFADESWIRQLAVILVDNAFKYCDEKGAIAVAFSKARIGRQVRLTVSNSYAAGKGQDYSRFFERFYREDASHTIDTPDDGSANKGGYGIGLSIAESICSRCKGSIRASWKDGVITFTCLLTC